MRHLLAAVLSAAAVLPAAGAAEVEVTARDGLVTIRAREAPLREVLDRLAGQTGMKVVYDGAPPAVAVSMTVEGLAERDAVVRLFEGLDLSYAFTLDPGGSRVATLLVAAPGSEPATPAARASRPTFPRRPEPERPEAVFQGSVEDEAPVDPEDPEPATANEGIAVAPGTPSLSTPDFPTAASFPRPMGFPGPLTFPSAASTPRAW